MIYIKPIHNNILFLCLISLSLFACGHNGDNEENSTQKAYNTGSYQCKLTTDNRSQINFKAAIASEGGRINCDSGISVMRFRFYNEANDILVEDKRPCSDHNALLQGIPAGTNRKLVVTAENDYGSILLSGEESNIAIVANEIAKGSQIILKSVISADDVDHDGFSKEFDCDDMNPDISPGAKEIPDNEIDENCDSLIMLTWYRDSDSDTFGDHSKPIISDIQPDGYVSSDTDCDDANPDIHPGAVEIPYNEIDENCDGQEIFINSFGMSFRKIEAGTFMMGSPADELGRDLIDPNENQHQVTLTRDFYMQTTEVTQGQWESVRNFSPTWFQYCGNSCPVENVSWYDVQEFIEVLNTMGEGIYRLPTEAEWEYAARAGSTTALPNGDLTEEGGITEEGCEFDPNLDAMVWYCGNSNSSPHPVALKSANDWGLYDMHGNVWEWCQDLYDDLYDIQYDPSIPVTDPSGPSIGSQRVIRGGSFDSVARDCRSATRTGYPPDDRLITVGFRLVFLSNSE